jgi:hypothetical protein
VGNGSATETDAAGAVADVAVETATEGAGSVEATGAAEDPALTGSGGGAGVEGARSHAALSRTRRRREARGLIGRSLLQENVG